LQNWFFFFLQNFNFSRDFLIALWFAAHDNKGKNGKVFVLNINDIVMVTFGIINQSFMIVLKLLLCRLLLFIA
jgi:hypothetical protein